MFHILTPFPELLNYAFFAPIILRIALGLISMDFGLGRKQIKSSSSADSPQLNSEKKSFDYFIQTIFILGGIFIIIGFYTQIVSIILGILFIIALFKPKWVGVEAVSRSELILLIAICLTLLLFGAGAFAIDYPL